MKKELSTIFAFSNLKSKRYLGKSVICYNRSYMVHSFPHLIYHRDSPFNVPSSVGLKKHKRTKYKLCYNLSFGSFNVLLLWIFSYDYLMNVEETDIQIHSWVLQFLPSQHRKCIYPCALLNQQLVSMLSNIYCMILI